MKSSNNKVQSNCKKREKIYRKYKSSKLFLTINKKNTIKIQVPVIQSVHILTTNKSPDTHQLLI